MKRSCSSVPQRVERRVVRRSCQNRATSARSSSCCARLMRACGGISNARISTSPRRPLAVSGEYSLSMQNSARCVLPVTSTSRCRKTRSTSHGGRRRARARELTERDLQLVQAVVPRLVDARRLARRADEESREQIRQRRMVVPVGDQAAQQIGPAQERAVGRRSVRRARSGCRRRCRCAGRRA